MDTKNAAPLSQRLEEAGFRNCSGCVNAFGGQDLTKEPFLRAVNCVHSEQPINLVQASRCRNATYASHEPFGQADYAEPPHPAPG